MPIKSPLRIRIVTPLSELSEAMRAATMAEIAPLASLGLEFALAVLEAGPSSIENEIDEALAAPNVVVAVGEAERAGFDAVIIDCMGDPGLTAAREAVSIPVIGPGEAALHVASIVGHRVGCISVLDSVRPILFARARSYGLGEKLVSVHTVDLPVLEIERNAERLPELLAIEARHMIEHERVDTVVLGCTGFLDVARELERRLVAAGYDVPVISPMPAAVLVAASLVWGGLRHSRRAYPLAGVTSSRPSVSA